MMKFSIDYLNHEKVDRALKKFNPIRALLETNESDYEIIKKLNISNYEDLEDYIIFQYKYGNNLCGSSTVASCLLVILQKYGFDKTIDYIKELPNKWFMKEINGLLIYKETFILLDTDINQFDDINNINNIINKYIILILNGVKRDYIFDMLFCFYRKHGMKNFIQLEYELTGYFIAEELLSSEEIKSKIKVWEINKKK